MLTPEDKPGSTVKYKCVEISDTDAKVIKQDENLVLHISTDRHGHGQVRV